MEKNSESKNKPIKYFQMNMPVVIPGTLGHHVYKDMPEESKKMTRISENLTAQSHS